MKDRIPQYPGRVKLVPVAGLADTYDMTRADDPIEIGTPLNKATFLTDETATDIWENMPPSNPTVNDALWKLNNLISADPKIAYGSYVGTGTYGNEDGAANKLTFDFIPRIIMIQKDPVLLISTPKGYNGPYTVIFQNPTSLIQGDSGSSATSAYAYLNIDWSGTTVTWWVSWWSGLPKDYSSQQFNSSGTVYNYIAIGTKEGI